MKYTIKPLEWIELSDGSFAALTRLGHYVIAFLRDNDGEILSYQGFFNHKFFRERPTIEEAKAAAQAHWESKLREVLEEA